MTTATQRRGPLRPITSLPASPGGAAVVEVEIGGAWYQASYAAGGGLFTRAVIQLPLATNPFVELKGGVVSVTGPAVLDTTTTPYSAHFPSKGTMGQGIHIAQGSPINGTDFGAFGTFCLEGWFKTSENNQQYTCLASRDSGSGGQGAWSLLINTDNASDGKVSFWSGWYGTPAVKSVSAYNDGMRHHVAVVQMGAWWGLYMDGTLVATVIASPTYASVLTQDIILGGANYASREFTGWLDNWRITMGPVYAGQSFTVPTPPFPSA